MPKGDSPNSRRALMENGKRFARNDERTREAGRKSQEVQRKKRSFLESFESLEDPDAYAEVFDTQLKSGDRSFFEMYFKLKKLYDPNPPERSDKDDKLLDVLKASIRMLNDE